MIKFIAVISIGVFLTNPETNGQAKIDTVLIEGYVVQEFLESSIKSFQKTIKDKIKGNSNSVSVDNPIICKFYPILKKEMLKDAIDKQSENLHAFYLSYNSSEQWLNKTFMDKLGIRKSGECTICDNSPFIKIKGKKNKLYRAYYSKGLWLQINVDSSDVDFLHIKKRANEISIDDSEKYTFFIMISCDVIKRYIDFKVDRNITLTNYLY